MFSEEHLYSLALRRCTGVGNVNFKKIIETIGSAQEAWQFSKSEFKNQSNIEPRILANIGNEQHLKYAEKELSFCEKNNIKILLNHHDELPFLLGKCHDAPAILYQKGEIEPNRKPISIVGTRNSTPYGKSFINHFLEEIKNMNTTTISGLALGTDGEVHTKSLQKDIPTIAVLAHGFHTIYPAKHHSLAENILGSGGALITEYSSHMRPDRELFIQRNRIVAGISPATLVIETAFGGGSISTVGFANQYDRDVYALPGKINDKYSQGCNHLIYKNKAAAISNIKDLIEDLFCFDEKSPYIGDLFSEEKSHPPLNEQQKNIYEIIAQYPNINLDDLSEKAELLPFQILPILLELEILGCIRSFSGRQFTII